LQAFSAEFNPLHPDYELLNQLVLEKINSKRAKKHATEIASHKVLGEVASFYTNTYVLRKFENSEDNRLFIKKKIRKICKAHGYDPRLTTFTINTLNAIRYTRRSYYYDKEENESELHLYYGDHKPTKKEKQAESYKPEAMKLYSYEEIANLIAEQLIKSSGRLKTLNTAYSQIGLSCAVEPRSIGGRKIPQLKIIMLLGGKIITW
jgi:hypothetical protein